MLKFPAAPLHHHDFRLEHADDSPLVGGRRLHSPLQSKIVVSYKGGTRHTVTAADCGDFGKGFPVQFGDQGRVFAQHVLQILRRKRDGSEIQKLPIYFYKDGQQQQYAWDGQSLFVESVDSKLADGVVIRDRKFWGLGTRRVLRTLQRTFVPEHVRPHYLSYMKWKFIHRVLSSVLQVQCTQAMLQAIGIGARRALPAAASLNWVLKDGLGRLGRFAYSGALGSTFDSNLKRVRFSTSVLFSLSLGLEMLTPYFPSYFLFLATMANVGRSIALAAYLATSSAIHKSFATSDNLADIAAKGQVQTVVADNLGLAVSCALSTIVRSDRRLEPLLLLVIYPVLTGLDLFAIYHELQAVHLQSLNKVRLEIIVENWVRNKKVPSAEEVSILEGLQFFRIPGRQTLPLRIGPLNPVGWKPDDVLHAFQSQAQQPYALFQDSHSPIPVFHQLGLLLWMRDDFSPKDVITAVLQVGHLREIASCESLSSPRDKTEDKKTINSIDSQDSRKGRGSPVNLRERWCILVRRSRQQAVVGVDSLLAAMEENGWQTKHILLAPSERHAYSTKLEEKC